MATVHQIQLGWGSQQPLGHDGRPMSMVQELYNLAGQMNSCEGKQIVKAQDLPRTPGGPFIAELDGGDFQWPPELHQNFHRRSDTGAA